MASKFSPSYEHPDFSALAVLAATIACHRERVLEYKDVQSFKVVQSVEQDQTEDQSIWTGIHECDVGSSN
jgi:hypothetical protein